SQRGERALSGYEEQIPSHRFPPDDKRKIIYFKGAYLSIINKETSDQLVFKENLTEFEDFEIPPKYTCYVRG
ncbi:hypothetical protein P175DRAFT_0410892, partial [Aspergillus ochraceoroseus IBT 24754]